MTHDDECPEGMGCGGPCDCRWLATTRDLEAQVSGLGQDLEGALSLCRKLEAENASLRATLDLRTRTMQDINTALVAALDRAERAEGDAELAMVELVRVQEERDDAGARAAFADEAIDKLIECLEEVGHVAAAPHDEMCATRLDGPEFACSCGKTRSELIYREASEALAAFQRAAWIDHPP